MARGLVRLALLAAAAGCASSSESQDPDRLPRAVAVAMVVGGGQPMTAWFSVEPNPRGHVDVRVANGLEFPGKDGVFGLDPVSPGRDAWRLTERLGGATVDFALPTGAHLRPLRLDDDEAWFYERDAVSGWACALRTGACRAVGDLPPELPLTRPGPGAGFALTLDDEGTLRFRQPHQGTTAGDIVASRVVDVVAVRWYLAAPSSRVAEYVDRTFRGRGGLRVRFGAVTVDGELDEWGDAEPEVVEAPWQAAVRDDWTGPDDASFSIAARWSADDLCFAGRLRDDVLTADDALTFVLRKDRYVLPLAAPELADFPAAVHAEAFGWHYEACVPRPRWTTERGDKPFSASLRDHDEGTDGDLLATAPVFGQLPVGYLELVP